MNGKIIAIAIIMITALFGAGLWYAQTRAYFEPVATAELVVTTASGDTLALAHSDFRGIDAASSPCGFGLVSASTQPRWRCLKRPCPIPSPPR